MSKTDFCDICHTAIQNDDWTHLDGMFETAELAANELYRQQGSADMLDWTHGVQHHRGYWQCFVCDSTELGPAHIYTDGDSWEPRD